VRAELVFRTPGTADAVKVGLREYLLGAGFEPLDDGTQSLVFQRGSGLGRLASLRIEDWPTTLHVRLLDVGEAHTGVLLRYVVGAGFHLVGALDRVALEIEAALMEEYLRSGQRRALCDVIAPVRRPVVVATLLNVAVAVAIVTWVGIMGGYALHWVVIAAVAVAFLDGVVIMAFADLLLEGMRDLPRLRHGAHAEEDADPAVGT